MHECIRSAEFRAVSRDGEENDGRTLEGYIAVYDTDTEIDSWEGHFIERIAKGAFKKTLRERTPVMQFNHGREIPFPIGVFTELREEDQGLYSKGRLFTNQAIEPIREAIAEGAISGMSFRFRVIRDEWRDNKGKLVKGDEIYRLLYEPGDRGPLVRTLKEVQMSEAGPVVFPAYAATSVSLRSIEEMTEEDRQKIVDEYRKTMLAGSEDEDRQESADSRDQLPLWLEAERTWQWLRAEELWRWLEAEKAWQQRISAERDAAPKGTSTKSGSPEDAARKGTSHREHRKKTAEHDAPEIVRTRGMTLDELKIRLAEISVRLEELGEEYRDAELPEAEQREWDGLKAEFDKHTESVRRIEKRAEEIKAMFAKTPDDGRFASGDRSDNRGGPAFHKRDDNIFDLEEIRSSSYGSTDFLQRVADNAHRAVDQVRYGARDKDAAKERIHSLLDDDSIETEERDLAKRILMTGSDDYVRGFAKILKHGSDVFCNDAERRALIRAQELGTDNKGGFAIPFQLDPTVVYTNAGVINPIRQLARVEQIVGKEWQGVQTAGTTAVRGAETGASAVAPDSTFTLAQPTLRTKRVSSFVPFTYESELAWGALLSEITRAFVDAKATEENSFITGDGTGDNPSGVVATLSGNTVNTAGVGAFAAADVYAVQNALDPRWEPNASWLAHKAIYHRIRQFDTSGGGMFWGSLAGGNPNTLLDYPVGKASAMANTVTSGSKILLHGDFRNFLIVDRIGMHIELLPNLVDPTTGRPIGQRGVYAVWMNNSKILVHNAFKLLVVA
jgi:HK97 family phage major capsid protein/HK97 family phage prohead protease